MTFIRFVFSGGFNTAVTYLAYLALLTVWPYWVAYTATYALGIMMAYVVNRYWVFRQHRGALSVVLLPMIYVGQYAIGMLVVWAWVSVAGLDARWAPLASIAITVPITYVLSRLVFTTRL